MTRWTQSRTRRALGVFFAIALVVSACGGGDDDDAGGDGAAPTAQESGRGEQAAEGDGGATASDDDAAGGSGDGGSGDGSAEQGSGVPDPNAETDGNQPAPEDRPEPQYGGTLRYAVEAGTQNPWVPQQALCAIACQAVARSVFDTLMMFDENLVPQPYLLESMVPNDDFTVWTLTAREGITFHDGTPFDGAAIARNMEEARGGLLTQFIVSNIASVSSDADTATITTHTPWASLPEMLAGVAGFIASPAWLDAVAAGTAPSTEPVGTGPFVYESFTPEEFAAVRNENYWREGLPYLDRVEFPVISDDEARVRALRSGQVDAIQGVTDARSVELAEDGFKELNDIGLAREAHVTLINNELITDVRIRRALAMAIDRTAEFEALNQGFGELANGPFAPGTVGYLEDTGYPKYDPEAARALIQEVEAETGEPVVIRLKVVGDPSGTSYQSLNKQFMEEAGMTVELDQTDQASLILQVVTGNYEVAAWRWYGLPTTDMFYPYFHSNAITPGMSSNFHRGSDPVIDEQFAIIRATLDPEERRAAAEAINRRLGEQANVLWNTWATWRIVHSQDVHDMEGPLPLPDGGTAVRMGLGGTAGDHNFAQIWKEQ